MKMVVDLLVAAFAKMRRFSKGIESIAPHVEAACALVDSPRKFFRAQLKERRTDKALVVGLGVSFILAIFHFVRVSALVEVKHPVDFLVLATFINLGFLFVMAIGFWTTAKIVGVGGPLLAFLICTLFASVVLLPVSMLTWSLVESQLVSLMSSSPVLHSACRFCSEVNTTTTFSGAQIWVIVGYLAFTGLVCRGVRSSGPAASVARATVFTGVGAMLILLLVSNVSLHSSKVLLAITLT